MNDSQDDVAQKLGLAKPNQTRRYRTLEVVPLAVALFLALFGKPVLDGQCALGYFTAPVGKAEFDLTVIATVAFARLATAMASLREAREVYQTPLSYEERGGTVRRVFVVNEARCDRARAELQSAQAECALAGADLDLHQTKLDKACIRSAVEGVIQNRAVNPGQIVVFVLSAPIHFDLVEDPAQMELRLDIDEDDVEKVEMDRCFSISTPNGTTVFPVPGLQQIRRPSMTWSSIFSRVPVTGA